MLCLFDKVLQIYFLNLRATEFFWKSQQEFGLHKKCNQAMVAICIYYTHASVKGVIAHIFSWFWDGYVTLRNATHLFHKTLAKIKNEKINYSASTYEKICSLFKNVLMALANIASFCLCFSQRLWAHSIFPHIYVLRNNWIILNVTGLFHPFTLFTHIKLAT